jgi:23S rRNA (cytidine1920-2'-O)/16S rRNA (cytidine1409-2'-O)-methyltransferase
MQKLRADVLLFEKGLVESRSMAQRLVMAGQVRANGHIVSKPSVMLSIETDLEIEALPKYVSRGAFKLEKALDIFNVSVSGKICADVGASTGGFTDCLLQNGASKVYAIDVGRGQLHWKIRQDERVVVMEKSNARHISALPEKIDLITVDTSFISLRIILPVVMNWLASNGEIITLVKPQFEVGKQEADISKGVIRDPRLHKKVLEKIINFSRSTSLFPSGLIASPIKGTKGNIEFLLWLSRVDSRALVDEDLVSSALAMASDLGKKK